MVDWQVSLAYLMNRVVLVTERCTVLLPQSITLFKIMSDFWLHSKSMQILNAQSSWAIKMCNEVFYSCNESLTS